MRRQSPGVVSADALVPELIKRVEREDPARVVRLLEPFVLERRAERLRQVIAARLSSVQVVFDAPHDPHNGAAVVRSCEALGVQNIHVIERIEPFLAASSVCRGAEKWVDIRAWPSVSACVEPLRRDGFELVAASADGELDPADLAAIPRLALVFGNERDGIATELAASCARRVRVPMRGFVESLNVSVSAAILLAFATAKRAGDLNDDDRQRLYARGLYFSVQKADEILQNFD